MRAEVSAIKLHNRQLVVGFTKSFLSQLVEGRKLNQQGSQMLTKPSCCFFLLFSGCLIDGRAWTKMRTRSEPETTISMVGTTVCLLLALLRIRRHFIGVTVNQPVAASRLPPIAFLPHRTEPNHTGQVNFSLLRHSNSKQKEATRCTKLVLSATVLVSFECCACNIWRH